MHRIITIEKKPIPDKVSVMAGWVSKTYPPEVIFPTCIIQGLHLIWFFGDSTIKLLYIDIIQISILNCSHQLISHPQSFFSPPLTCETLQI